MARDRSATTSGRQKSAPPLFGARTSSRAVAATRRAPPSRRAPPRLPTITVESATLAENEVATFPSGDGLV